MKLRDKMAMAQNPFQEGTIDSDGVNDRDRAAFEINQYEYQKVMANKDLTVQEVAEIVHHSYGYAASVIRAGVALDRIRCVGKSGRRPLYTWNPAEVSSKTPDITVNGATRSLYAVMNAFLSAATKVATANDTESKRQVVSAVGPIARRARRLYLVLGEYYVWVTTTGTERPLVETRDKSLSYRREIGDLLASIRQDIRLIDELVNTKPLWNADEIRWWRVADEFTEESLQAIRHRGAVISDVMDQIRKEETDNA